MEVRCGSAPAPIPLRPRWTRRAPKSPIRPHLQPNRGRALPVARAFRSRLVWPTDRVGLPS